MLATIAGFLKILALFGLIGLALFAVMMWVALIYSTNAR